MRRFAILPVFVVLVFLSGCPAPQGSAPEPAEEKGREAPPVRREPLKTETFLGAWTTHDGQGQTFDIVLFPNGQAISNRMKGTAPALGERGFWRLDEDGVTILYSDGWTDRIVSSGEEFLHQGFAPAGAQASAPAEPTAATRVEGPAAGFVGIWRLNKEPDGNYLYVSLHSSGTAISTVNAEGTWTVSKDGAHCVWPDGWNDLIFRTDDGYKKRAWVGAEQATTLPDFSTATRVGEAKFVITP